MTMNVHPCHGPDGLPSLSAVDKLERHEGELYRGDGKRTPTVAVARIIKILELKYLKGRVNYLWIQRY